VVFSTSDFTTQTVNAVYVSDGTAAGTIEIAQGVSNTFDNAVLGNKLYFSAIDTNGDLSLYATDGTAANTNVLTPLAAETGVVPGDVGKGAVCLTVYNNKLYFRNEQNGSGIELWQSDGTVAGTSMLKDIYPGSFSTRPNSFCVLNNRLYFRADDSFRLNLHYTDGTTAGTVQIPSPLPDYPVVNPFTRKSFMSYPLVPVGSSLYFTNPYDMSTAIYRLAVPAGVTEVTGVSVIDIYPNPSSGYINVDVADAASVRVCDISGKEVYKSGVTSADKIRLIDVGPFDAGVYTINTFLRDGGMRSGKFVKK
ncbi:MAG TPA: T9SS type A sorting domain-containing protein, partial [Flavipsychrobacter sp.]|nr:T9SS type A sorting domain-containing protein [Flavipsychrobacter sp.]